MHHTISQGLYQPKEGSEKGSLFEQFYESYLILIGAHCFHGFYDKCPSKPPKKFGLKYNARSPRHLT